MLHGVMEENYKASWTPLRPQLTPGELKRTLTLLSKNYQFVTIEQAVDMLSGKLALIDNAMLITFDDGYRNNLKFALPICEQFSIKPVLFLTTGNVDSRLPFWVDRLDYALQQHMGEIISFSYGGITYQFDATSRQSLKKSYKQFRDGCKNRFSDEIKMNQLIDALSEKLELQSGKALATICEQDDWSAIVAWDQLRDVVKSKRIDVASHTVDHWRLNCLPEEYISSQLQQSKVRIEQELAVKCQFFCYPNGNYNDVAINLVEKIGYKAAFSTDVGLCGLKDDLMTLKRFNFPSDKSESELLYLLNR